MNLKAGKILDILIAERVMGESLKPHRDKALVAIGRKYTQNTGPTFMLTNGREIPMPNGEKLRKPQGSTDWNERYFLHVAEVLGTEVAAEVEAYRTAPVPYSTTIGMAFKIVARMRDLFPIQRETQTFSFQLDQVGITGGWHCSFVINQGDWSTQAFVDECETAPLALCLAGLKAVGYHGTATV